MSSKWERAKDEDEVLDYEIDWIGTASEPGELFGTEDTLVSSSWTVPAEITMDSDSIVDEVKTVIWLSGGTNGETYELLNRVVTADGRTMDKTVRLKMKEA